MISSWLFLENFDTSPNRAPSVPKNKGKQISTSPPSSSGIISACDVNNLFFSKTKLQQAPKFRRKWQIQKKDEKICKQQLEAIWVTKKEQKRDKSKCPNNKQLVPRSASCSVWEPMKKRKEQKTKTTQEITEMSNNEIFISLIQAAAVCITRRVTKLREKRFSKLFHFLNWEGDFFTLLSHFLCVFLLMLCFMLSMINLNAFFLVNVVKSAIISSLCRLDSVAS